MISRLYSHHRRRANACRGDDSKEEQEKSRRKKSRVAFDPEFLRQLRALLRIMVPGVFSKEAGLIGKKITAGENLLHTYIFPLLLVRHEAIAIE